MSPADEADLRRLILAEYRKCEFRVSACEGKFSFLSPVHARQSSLFRRDTHGRLAIYRCQHCHKFHIGSSTGSKARDARPKGRAA
jgi:hypothetical protein